MHKKVIQVISLIILMLALTACVSHPKEEKTETAPAVKTVFFPAFPEPPEDIKPLDKDNNVVISDDTEVVYVALPYWYWNLIIDYVEETEQAVTSLTAQHPP